MRKKYFGLLFAVLLLSTGTAFASTAVANIHGTKEGSTISGKAVLEDTKDGLQISLKLENVPSGKHGFHIHENGSCADGGNAAGGHFNPDGLPHGLLFKDGITHAHAGDLGNLVIGPSGSGTFETVVKDITLAGGKHNVAGRAFILHEKEDDFGQPTGNAGGRIACGVIEQDDKDANSK